jgi:hypothetical protein
VFSAKPSPISARPTQLVNVDVGLGSRASPWPIRNPVNLTALGLPRPEALVSRIGFPGANLTELMKPTKLQELVVQLGCTFRMPLEKIRIMNITVFEILRNRLRIVNFDPVLVNLNSQGQIACMSSNSRSLRNRVLQTSGSSTNSENINVEYAILEPSDDLLSLEDDELGLVLAASSPLNNFQASVGAAAGPATEPVSPPTAPSASSSMSDDARVRIGLGVGLGVTAFVALAAIGTLTYRRRGQTRGRRPTRSVHVVFTTQTSTMNPVSNPLGYERRVFNPMQSRV